MRGLDDLIDANYAMDERIDMIPRAVILTSEEGLKALYQRSQKRGARQGKAKS